MKTLDQLFQQLQEINQFKYKDHLHTYHNFVPPIDLSTVIKFQIKNNINLPKSFVQFITNNASGILSLRRNENILDPVSLTINTHNNSEFKSINLIVASASAMKIIVYMDVSDDKGRLWWKFYNNGKLQTNELFKSEEDDISCYFENLMRCKLEDAIKNILQAQDYFNKVVTKSWKFSLFEPEEFENLIPVFSKIFNLEAISHDAENEWEWIEGKNDKFFVNIRRRHYQNNGDFTCPISINLNYNIKDYESSVQQLHWQLIAYFKTEIQYTTTDEIIESYFNS